MTSRAYCPEMVLGRAPAPLHVAWRSVEVSKSGSVYSRHEVQYLESSLGFEQSAVNASAGAPDA